MDLTLIDLSTTTLSGFFFFSFSFFPLFVFTPFAKKKKRKIWQGSNLLTIPVIPFEFNLYEVVKMFTFVKSTVLRIRHAFLSFQSLLIFISFFIFCFSTSNGDLPSRRELIFSPFFLFYYFRKIWRKRKSFACFSFIFFCSSFNFPVLCSIEFDQKYLLKWCKHIRVVFV